MAVRSSRFSRLGRKEIWGLPLLFLTGWIYAFLSLLFDAILQNAWSPFWILIFIVTFAEVVLLAWGYRVQILNRFNINSAWLNLGVAGLLGLVKNVTVAPIAISLGLLPDPLWSFRFFGGFTLGVGIFVFAGLALGARTEHTAVMAQLTQVQQALLALRTSSRVRLNEANAALASGTRDLLLPKLEQLQDLVRGVSGAGAVENLRKLIQEDVRPLSETLNSQASAMAEEPVSLSKIPKRYNLFLPQVELRGLIRPNAAAVSNSVGGLLLAYAIMGAPRCNSVFYLSFVSWGLAWGAKLLIPVGLKVSRRRAVWSLFAIGTMMFAPMYLIALTEVETPTEPWLLLVLWPSALVSLMSFAFSESLDRDRVAVRGVLEAENQALAHDQALFEQQLWLGRRAWQFVVHGTVQSALTAALTRLQSSPEPEQYVLNRVVDDIDRARNALTASPARKIDLADSFNQMQATWRGICDINISITDRAGRSLQKNNDACMCVNEIVKEAVSNAVRHGDAKKVWVDIDRIDDFDLALTVSNDGVPLSAQTRLGVGSRLIEELTTDWSLESSKASGLTVFKANLPLQRSWS
jgi:two-component sensor histidine kinase/phage FluMu protein gp41